MANISKVYLLNTPLEDDLKHTLYFANANAQHTYMEQNIKHTYTNVSYQRDTSTFRCPAHIDTIRTCSYMMYQNSAYSNKWFYCFIEKMTYVNDGMTDVEFKVDPIQTFMFDFETQPSFIEREHTNDDTIGANVVPEQLELGDYVNSGLGTQSNFGLLAHECYVIAVTKLIDQITTATEIMPVTPKFVKLTSIPDGFIYIGLPNINAVNDMILLFNNAGHGDYINSLFIVPSACFQSAWTVKVNNVGGQNFNIPVYQNYQPKMEGTCSVTTNNTLAGNYSPRNAKLLTYPFRYLQMSNNNGSIANYHYEDFRNPLDGSIDTTPEFKMVGYGSVSVDAKVYPCQYRGIQENFDEGLSYPKVPVGAWATDVYTNWLTQNGINIATGFISDLVSVGVGVATAPEGGGMAIASGVTGIANRIGQIYQHSMQPPQAEGGGNIGNASYVWGKTGVTFKHMSIRTQFARIADDFFDMFGYATHRVKKPNYAHRANWWYTKTIDIYIKGDIPNEYMNEIKNAYNNGITYWRNPANFMNYSVSNGIV